MHYWCIVTVGQAVVYAKADALEVTDGTLVLQRGEKDITNGFPNLVFAPSKWTRVQAIARPSGSTFTIEPELVLKAPLSLRE